MINEARPVGEGLLRNPVFLSAVFSLLTAQFVKALINVVRYRSRSFREVIVVLLWKTGGMPSSHSALVVALATSIGFAEGFGSTLFILALFVGLIVIRDAMGVRRSAGLQARVLNGIGKELAGRFGTAYHPVKEVQGHDPAQVLVGGLLGFFIALAFCTL